MQLRTVPSIKHSIKHSLTRWEFTDIISNTYQHSRALHMVAPLDVYFNKDIAVQDHEICRHFMGNLYFVFLQFLVHTEQYIVGVSVVTCKHNI